MNCKPGDLAFRVRAPDGAYIKVGAVVRCVEYSDIPSRSRIGFTEKWRVLSGAWVVEYNGTSTSPTGLCFRLPDEELRPIRGDGLTDDTPAEIDKPHPVEA